MWSANPALRGDVAATRAILQERARPFTGGLEGIGPLVSDTMPDTMPDNVNRASGPLATMMEAAMDAAYQRSCLAQTDLNAVPNNVAGYGVVDAYAAVKAALARP
jgi:hypothetical protein